MIQSGIMLFLSFLAVHVTVTSARPSEPEGKTHRVRGLQNRASKNNEMIAMQNTINSLFDHHQLIEREYNTTSNGIEAYTHSNDPQVAKWIQTHVHQMKELLEGNGSIRQWDDLFEIAFDLRDLHEMSVDNTVDGVRVVQHVTTGVEGQKKVCSNAIIQAHAAVLSKFVEIGQKEAKVNHDVPDECMSI